MIFHRNEVAQRLTDMQMIVVDLQSHGWAREVPTEVGIALTKVKKGLMEAQTAIEPEPTFRELEEKAKEEN